MYIVERFCSVTVTVLRISTEHTHEGSTVVVVVVPRALNYDEQVLKMNQTPNTPLYPGTYSSTVQASELEIQDPRSKLYYLL
jgi:hypothetical protein